MGRTDDAVADGRSALEAYHTLGATREAEALTRWLEQLRDDEGPDGGHE